MQTMTFTATDESEEFVRVEVTRDGIADPVRLIGKAGLPRTFMSDGRPASLLIHACVQAEREAWVEGSRIWTFAEEREKDRYFFTMEVLAPGEAPPDPRKRGRKAGVTI